MRTLNTNARRGLAAIATVGLLAGPLAACSSDDTQSSSSSDSSESSASPESQAPPEPVASVEALQGQQTQIMLDQGFLDALEQLQLTPGTTGEGGLQNGTLSFPITGGNVTVFEKGEVSPYVIGQLQHEGAGLSLSAGGTTVELTNFNVDPGASRVYGDVAVNGETAVTSAYLFSLDGRTLNPLETQGQNAVLQGTKVMISPVAAPLLNDTFQTDAVAPGLLVGTAKITVNTQPAAEG